MDLEPFVRGDSFLHRADGRAKILVALALSIVISLIQHWPVALLAWGVGLVFVLLARLPLALVARRFLLVNLFILLLWVTLPLAGPATMTIWSVPLNGRGLSLALLITLKSNAILAVLLGLVATSSLAVLGQALLLLKMPEKFCLLLLYTYRYIFVLQREFGRLHRAAVLRGFVPATSLHTYRTYGNLVGMTLVRGWDRGRRVRQAMELRGFTGRYYALHDAVFARADMSLLLLGLAWAGCLVWLDGGWGR